MSGLDDFDAEMLDMIDELVDSLELEKGTPAHGIALKVACEGLDLSPKQKYVFDKNVVPLLKEVAEEWEMNARANSAVL